MGWAGATEIFDTVAEFLLDEKKINRKEVLKALIKVLEDGDWDTQSESEYYDNPVVQEIFEEIDSEEDKS